MNVHKRCQKNVPNNCGINTKDMAVALQELGIRVDKLMAPAPTNSVAGSAACAAGASKFAPPPATPTPARTKGPAPLSQSASASPPNTQPMGVAVGPTLSTGAIKSSALCACASALFCSMFNVQCSMYAYMCVVAVGQQPDAYRRPLLSVCGDEAERPAGGHKTLGRQAHGAHGAQHAASHHSQSVMDASGEGCCAPTDAHSLAESGVAASSASLVSASAQSVGERLSVSSRSTLLSGSSVVASELSDGRGGAATRPLERAASLSMRDKYTMEQFDLIKVLGKGSFGKVLLLALYSTFARDALSCAHDAN